MAPLIGRTHELATLERWLAGHGRLLSIVGTAGVGKSRLAHHVASSCAPSGSLICDLTACRSDGDVDVERALARTLGVSKARLTRALTAFEGLIVLDRFEHLVSVGRTLIERWTSSPGPRFVITSREPLGIFAEEVLPLAPLAPADAAALYVACRGGDAERIQPHLVSKIVARLDGLPLAIELTAARASLLADREVLARLEQGNVQDALRVAIRGSIDLLSPEERTTLLGCAMFRGPFDGRAAEAVVGASAQGTRHESDFDVVSCLLALERKSLLRRIDTTHVALYDAVREVAREAATACGLDHDLRARHAEHCARVAGAVLDSPHSVGARSLPDGPDLAAAHAFVRDRDPLAAVKLALAIDHAQAGHAPSPDHVALLSSAVADAERAADLEWTARARLARANARRLLGNVRGAVCDLRAALGLSRRLSAGGGGHAGNVEVETDVLRLLGVVSRQQCKPIRARILLERALHLIERARLPERAALVLDDLGVVAHDLGDLPAARERYEQAVAMARVTKNRRFEGIGVGQLGLVAHECGDLVLAQSRYDEALAIHREVGDARFEAFAHAFMATKRLEHGELDLAQRAIDAAMAIDARLGDLDSCALLAGIAAAVAVAGDHVVEGRALLARARLDLGARDEGALVRMLDSFALVFEVAEVRRAKLEGRSDDARARERAVREALASSDLRRVEERLARRATLCLLDRTTRDSVSAEDAAAAILVADDGTWFMKERERISLGTRRALAAMLASLAQARQRSPGRSVGLETLFEAGWPGERVLEASAKRRVYVGIDTLRSLGLRAAIVQRDRGYLLDPRVGVDRNDFERTLNSAAPGEC